jgi:hypothetical protein
MLIFAVDDFCWMYVKLSYYIRFNELFALFLIMKDSCTGIDGGGMMLLEVGEH